MEENQQSNTEQTGQGTIVIAGERPIGSSGLQIAGTVSIAGLRPISTSTLQVVETYNALGIR
ncbi:hypothetical protein FHK99_01990, partial [Cylindrospermopsis raciborskii CS-506_B]|nr:hypothetical protein [Cylindrospermopsis raciborskii CS-506_B]